MAKRVTRTPDQTVQRAFALEGRLTPKALQQVLQRVLNSRSAAYLLVSDGVSEKCFFFPVGAVRLTAIGPRSVFRLDKLILGSSALSAATKAEIERLCREEGRTFEEASQAAGQTELVRRASTTIVRDELLDAIVWPEASYEYHEINPPPRFYDHRLPSVKLSFGAKALLEEASEACERWHKALGRRQVVGHTPVRMRSQPMAVAGVSRDLQDRVLELLGREPQSFDEAVLTCRRRGIDAVEGASALVALADAGIVDMPTRPPSRSSEERRAAAAETVQGVESGLDIMINELIARQRLADGYEELGDERRAADHLRFVARELENRQRFNDAVDAYKRVIKISPRDFQLRRRVMGIYERLGRAGEAFDEGLRLARDLRTYGLLNRAKQVFRHLVGLRHDDTDVRRELVDLLLRMREKDEAVRELQELGVLYDHREQDKAALACQQQILQLDPQNEVARRRLTRAVRRSWAFLTPYVGLAAGALVVTTLGLLLLGRYRTVAAFQAARQVVLERVRERDYSGAREVLSSFELSHGAAPEQTLALRQQIAEFERRAHDTRAAEAYGLATQLEAEGRIDAARRRYVDVVGGFRGTRWAEQAQADMERLNELEREAGRLARKLVRLNEQLRRAGEASEGAYLEAVEAARDLVQRFGWSAAAQRAEVPVRVRSTPPGASVRIDGIEVPGRTTPFDILQPVRPAFAVTVAAFGFEPATRTIDLASPDAVLPIDVELQRRRSWRFLTLGPLAATPLVTSDLIVVGGADQRVYGLGHDGRERWRRPLGLFADIAGPPLYGEGVVVVCDRRGNVTALDARTGVTRWERSHGQPVLAIGTTAPGGGAAIIQKRQTLVAHRLRDGEVLWETPALGERLAVAATAVPSRGIVLCAAQDGRLSVVSAETGRVILPINLKAQPSSPVAWCGVGYAVVTDDGLLRVISTDGQRYLWQRPMPGPVTAMPGYDGEALFVGAGERLLAFRAQTGEALRLETDRFTSPVQATPVVSGGVIYVACTDGRVFALARSTGRLQWVYRTGGAVLSAVEVVGDTVFVASTDYGLHAIQN